MSGKGTAPMTAPEHRTTAGNKAAAEAIHEMLRPFRDEAEATRQAIEDRSRTQRRINAWVIGLVAVIGVMVVLMLWMLVKDGQRRAQSRELLKNNADLSARIADCTSVGGKCYEQGQLRLKGAIIQLTETNKAIVLCSKTTDSDAELDACVQARMKKIPRPATG